MGTIVYLSIDMTKHNKILRLLSVLRREPHREEEVYDKLRDLNIRPTEARAYGLDLFQLFVFVSLMFCCVPEPQFINSEPASNHLKQVESKEVTEDFHNDWIKHVTERPF